MPHPTELAVEELLVQCSFERTRRQGPGGQHRNKTETAVVVTHEPTGVRGEASERRSQAQNRAVAIHRLRVRLAVEVRDPERVVPSALWAARTSGGRLAVSDSHADFPTLLAEALDVLVRNRFAVAESAAELGVSSSQLVKLVAKEGTALALVNRERGLLGLNPIKAGR